MRVSRRQASRWAELAKAPGAILPTVRKRPRAPKVTVSEKDLQSRAENLCLALGIRFFRLPDSLLAYLARCPDAWVRVFVSRYLAGVPDLLLFKRLNNGTNVCKMIEIKTEAGKLSQGQEKWHSGLNVTVTYGWPDTEKAIIEFAQQSEGSHEVDLPK